MKARVEEVIRAEKAACLIFETSRPNPHQVGAVREMIQRGELKPSQQGRYMTTRLAVAEYLAEGELRKQEVTRTQRDRKPEPADEEWTRKLPQPSRDKAAKKDTPAAHRKRSAREQSDHELRRVYRELLSEYFLSVFTYGRARNRSPQIERAVFITRCVLALMILAVGIWSISSMLTTETRQEDVWREAGTYRLAQHSSPERQVVEKWLALYRTSAEMLDILPAHERPGGKAIRVRYRFVPEEGEPIVEDTVFVIANDEVFMTELPDPQDKALEADTAKKEEEATAN